MKTVVVYREDILGKTRLSSMLHKVNSWPMFILTLMIKVIVWDPYIHQALKNLQTKVNPTHGL